MSEGAEKGPAVMPLVGDSAVLGEVGAGVGRRANQARGGRTVLSGEGALSPDSCGRE